MKKMKLMKKTVLWEVESLLSKQVEQQVPSSFEWEDGQRSWKTDDQQLELVSMFLLDVFSLVILNGFGVP